MQAIDLTTLAVSTRSRLVAAEVDKDGGATLFSRRDSDRIESERVDFQPWCLVAGAALAASIPGQAASESLQGDGVFNVRVTFPDTSAYFAGLKHLRDFAGRPPSAPDAPYRLVADLTQQLLMTLPARLFRGMVFEDLRRLQLDIETTTTSGFDFPNPEREHDAIVMIAMRDSTGWQCCLAGPERSEAELLQEMVDRIRARDPDVVEGHNLFNFDLPFIEARCRRHRVPLCIGRNGSVARTRVSRFAAGERMLTYRRYDVYGRHVVDTYQLAQLYDVSHRDLESYGLKAIARYFGVAAPDRTYVDGAAITELYATDPKRLQAYAMDDVLETEAVGRILSPSYFHQAQLVPFSYQNCVTRGNAARIDAMLVAAYLNEDRSLPRPQAPRSFQGGLTESPGTGVFRNVWHLDVRSLYPSIILSRRLSPRGDSLRVYERFLAALRQFRLTAKDATRNASPPGRDYWEALQSSFKILINSFYGYVGFGQATFNDFDMAETITRHGREILRSMLEFLESRQAQVIEMDTDGIYFVPPADVTDTGRMQELVQEILPPGIEVELDTTYATMLSYKSKNYALLDHEGKVHLTGAALKSRGLAPFQRRYIRDLLALLLHGRGSEADALLQRSVEAIRTHRLPLSDVARREVLSAAPASYRNKRKAGKARRSAAYELVLASSRDYRQGDQVAYYVTGDKKGVAVVDAAKLLADADPAVRDENVPYYLDKLHGLHAKFAVFLPETAAAGEDKS